MEQRKVERRKQYPIPPNRVQTSLCLDHVHIEEVVPSHTKQSTNDLMPRSCTYRGSSTLSHQIEYTRPYAAQIMYIQRKQYPLPPNRVQTSLCLDHVHIEGVVPSPTQQSTHVLRSRSCSRGSSTPSHQIEYTRPYAQIMYIQMRQYPLTQQSTHVLMPRSCTYRGSSTPSHPIEYTRPYAQIKYIQMEKYPIPPNRVHTSLCLDNVHIEDVVSLHPIKYKRHYAEVMHVLIEEPPPTQIVHTSLCHHDDYWDE